MPEVHFFIGRLFRTEVGAPVVREALEPGAFGWRQPPHGVSALDCTGTFCNEGGLQFLLEGRCELGVLPLIEGVSANAIAHGSWVFIIPCKDGRRFLLRHLRETARGHGVDDMAVNGVEGEGNILVYTIALGAVLILSTDHGALQYKGLLLCSRIGTHHRRAVAQVTNLITLILRESDYGNAALVAGGISTVSVKRPCGFRISLMIRTAS